MPRKAAEALLVQQVQQERPKLDVPYDLREEEGEVWRAVVSAMPADYFSSAQVPHLKQYCQIVVMTNELQAEWLAAKQNKRIALKAIAKKRREWMQALELANRYARSMRLTHQAVYEPKTAARRQRDAQQNAADALWASNETADG